MNKQVHNLSKSVLLFGVPLCISRFFLDHSVWALVLALIGAYIFGFEEKEIK